MLRRIHLIMAARPNFMKVAPLYHALTRTSWAEPVLIHTGQHYDKNMSDLILQDLSLPEPHIHLGIGSGSHAEQTGRTMIAYEKVCLEDKPDLVVVVGDVNATVACALVAAKCHVPLAHLEAGLRSGDRRMPEETNRIVTDSIADILWTPSSDADANLIREGVAPEKIEFVGNIMIDSLVMLRDRFETQSIREDLGLEDYRYAVATLHRPSNVDDVENLTMLVAMLRRVGEAMKVVFPVHPRTRKLLEQTGLLGELRENNGVLLVEPLPYMRFMGLLSRARVAITDSGGIQEETTYLGIPCLTLRDTTERPVTVSEGTNRLSHVDQVPYRIEDIIAGRWPTGRIPKLWDGATAKRIVEGLERRFGIGGLQSVG